MLFHHPDLAHDHAAVHGLAHVVHGEQADLHGGQRFHFHAGLAEGFHLRLAVHAGVGCVGLKIDGHARQGQRVAQGDQVAGALGGHDGGDAGDAQHVAFFCRATHDAGPRVRLQADRAGSDGDAVGLRLGADVDHVGLAGGVEVGQVVGWGEDIGHGRGADGGKGQ